MDPIDRDGVIAEIESRFGVDWREAVADISNNGGDGVRWRQIIAMAANKSACDWRGAVTLLSGESNWRRGLLTIGTWLPLVLGGDAPVYPELKQRDDVFYGPVITPPPVTMAPGLVADDDVILATALYPAAWSIAPGIYFDQDDIATIETSVGTVRLRPANVFSSDFDLFPPPEVSN
jgi:hypothetical protein